MANWLENLASIRSMPALWVERIWLVSTREPLSVIREISLRPGVNVVWAQEPEDASATGRQAAGHGVGKTSLCLLLRYILCDEADSISTLRDEAHANFPDGGIAATVHIENETWIVFRPFSPYRQPLAGHESDIESLFASESNALFDEYRESLSTAFIQPLPVNVFPGSGQPMGWRHLLAWCTRDQRTRFDSFFHWRAGEGTGLRRTKQDPPLLVKAVLGILDVEAANLLSDIETAEQQITQLDKAIEYLEREPKFHLNRVETALRRAAGADASTPIEAPDLITLGVLTQLDSNLDEQAQREQKLEAEIASLDEKRQAVLQELKGIEDDANLWRLEVSRLQALLGGNQHEFERLTTEITSLRNRKGRCALGDVEFSDCNYIHKRLSTVSFQQLRQEKALAATKEGYAGELAMLEARLQPLTQIAESLRSKANGYQVDARRLETRRATSAVERKHLAELRQEYYERKRAQTEGRENDELAVARKKKSELEARQQSLQVKAELKRHHRTARVAQIARLTRMLAERLLGTNAAGWFEEHSDGAPFRLAVGGEAFHVLEVLLGDIVCLLDAVINSANRHPAFLIHDCPREADMSAHLYQDFLQTLREIEAHVGRDGTAPFQYLLTTTSSPPKKMQQEPYLRLVLKPGIDDGLLFKRLLVPQANELG